MCPTPWQGLYSEYLTESSLWSHVSIMSSFCTQTQRGWVACPRSPRLWAAWLGYKLWLPLSVPWTVLCGGANARSYISVKMRCWWSLQGASPEEQSWQRSPGNSLVGGLGPEGGRQSPCPRMAAKGSFRKKCTKNVWFIPGSRSRLGFLKGGDPLYGCPCLPRSFLLVTLPMGCMWTFCFHSFASWSNVWQLEAFGLKLAVFCGVKAGEDSHVFPPGLSDHVSAQMNTVQSCGGSRSELQGEVGCSLTWYLTWFVCSFLPVSRKQITLLVLRMWESVPNQ